MEGETLQISNHGHHTIGSLGPTKRRDVVSQVGQEIHRMSHAIEGCHHGTVNNLESLVTQGLFQKIRTCVGGRQDGEMGHERNARFYRP